MQERHSQGPAASPALHPSLCCLCPQDPAKPVGVVMAERSYRVLFWCLALVGLAADQASKYGVFAWLQSVPSHAYTVFQDPERGGFHLVAQFDLDSDGQLRPHVNHGALFGFL